MIPKFVDLSKSVYFLFCVQRRVMVLSLSSGGCANNTSRMPRMRRRMRRISLATAAVVHSAARAATLAAAIAALAAVIAARAGTRFNNR